MVGAPTAEVHAAGHDEAGVVAHVVDAVVDSSRRLRPKRWWTRGSRSPRRRIEASCNWQVVAVDDDDDDRGYYAGGVDYYCDYGDECPLVRE